MHEDDIPPIDIEDFLKPLAVDLSKLHSLSKKFCHTYGQLAAKSQNQFLPTPISESLLRPAHDVNGRYLAIDIGGTNLRVGFVHLLDSAQYSLSKEGTTSQPAAERKLEKSWPIGQHLKSNKADELFAWIGGCMAEVIRDGIDQWPGELPAILPMGVAFSFPMIQGTLSEATLMSMGKGFAITSNLDLAQQLYEGYAKSRTPSLPQISITAIMNDAVATLVTLAYRYRHETRRKAVMGLIVGTGSNATIPLPLSNLDMSKVPNVQAIRGTPSIQEVKIVVNTEWSINEAAPPMVELGIITRWDDLLSRDNETPGFQPFEYMTAGRYLGELGRLIVLNYFTEHLRMDQDRLPRKLLERYGLTTSFLGNLGPHLKESQGTDLIQQLNTELPAPGFWTTELAQVVFTIARSIQVRAAGLTAAAIIGLLGCAGEIPLSTSIETWRKPSCPEELMVGFTGGCIVHFQDYLEDCQSFLNAIVERDCGEGMPSIVLTPCHDGGILGAGILAGTVESAQRKD